MISPGPRAVVLSGTSIDNVTHEEAVTLVQVVIHEALLLREHALAEEICYEVGESQHHTLFARCVPREIPDLFGALLRRQAYGPFGDYTKQEASNFLSKPFLAHVEDVVCRKGSFEPL